MEMITVTDEMHDRIMGNILRADLRRASKNVIKFQPYRKYLLIAACFVILLAGVIAVPRIFNKTDIPPIVVAPEINEFGSAKELSESIGFGIKEISDIPFKPEKTSYVSYGGSIAEIVYSGENNSLRFRKSEGKEDISGDYNEYNAVNEISLNGCAVKIKGNDDRYNLAVWVKGGYSYSIQISEGVAEEEFIAIVKDVQEKQ
jgi:hypothetical protein